MGVAAVELDRQARSRHTQSTLRTRPPARIGAFVSGSGIPRAPQNSIMSSSIGLIVGPAVSA